MQLKRYFLLLLMPVWGRTPSHPAQEPEYLVIRNTTIVDVVQGSLIPGQTLIIKDSLILDIIDESSYSEYGNTQHLDGQGKYIIPGLWDMHFHLCWEKSNDSLLFKPLLSYGITGIRDMGGDLAIQKSMKNKIKMDPTIGPEIYGAGPILDGNPPVHYDFSISLDDDDEIAKLIDSVTMAGSDFIKVYSLLREPELHQIADYSIAKGIPFAGHLSEYVQPERSIELGQKSIEHLNRLEEIWEEDKKRFDRIAQSMRQSHTWLCPTLIIYYTKAYMAETSKQMENFNSAIHPALMQEWQLSKERRIEENNGKKHDELKAVFNSQLGLVGKLHRQGVRILAGSDFAGMPFVYPGIGLHQELALLCEAGLSPADALSAATINPAVFLSLDDRYGSVAPGKIADLVVLNDNPLEKIENIKAISLVLRKGKMVPGLMAVQNQPELIR